MTRHLLRRLLDPLSRIITAWNRFKSCDGDIGYFSDIKQGNICQALDSVNDNFGKLEDLQQRLLYLESSCRDSEKAVS